MNNLLAQAQQDVAYYQQELRRQLLNTSANSTSINYTRGKLIRALKQEYALTTDPTKKAMARANLLMETGRHHNSLKHDVKINKKSANYSITKELGLKMQKWNAAQIELAQSQSKKEAMTKGAKLAGQTLSTGFTMLKYPTTIALKGIGLLAPYVGMAFSQILQLPAYLLVKLINPDSPYNGRTITNMGKGLGEIVSQLSLQLDNGIKRL